MTEEFDCTIKVYDAIESYKEMDYCHLIELYNILKDRFICTINNYVGIFIESADLDLLKEVMARTSNIYNNLYVVDVPPSSEDLGVVFYFYEGKIQTEHKKITYNEFSFNKLMDYENEKN